MDALTKTLVRYMSSKTKTALSAKHTEVLNFAFEYYLKNKVGPLHQGIEKNTQVSKEELEKLFPQGLISVYSWLGIPTHSGQGICKSAVTIQVDDYREVYLDYASTTFFRKEIADCLKSYMENPQLYGNPSSSHQLGKFAYQILHKSRAAIAECLTVNPGTIFFTSGGTEANNLAIKGIAFNYLKNHGVGGQIISSKIEHSSVLNCLKFLETLGFHIIYLDVNQEGVVSPKDVEKHLKKETALVSVMAVNNEIGSKNSLYEIGKICEKANVPFMVDAVQAFGKIRLNPIELGISLLSISGHKIYGPKGIGCLYVKEGLSITPLLHGGDQEQGIRGGTENVGYIEAFSLAAQLAHQEMDKELERISELQAYFLHHLKRVEPNYLLNGTLEKKVPHILNIAFRGIDSGSLLLSLNHIGIYVSAGSACTAGNKESSHVIQALGVDTTKYGTIRFSFGLNTKKEDINYLIKYLPQILSQLRKT